VSKLSWNGTLLSLVYSTYLGGSSSDEGRSISIDSVGDAYVTGNTSSTNFPTVNPIQPTNQAPNSSNAFVTELNPLGSALVFSTYLGGQNTAFIGDEATAITTDSSGNIYVAGYTPSANFPTANAYQSALAGSANAFIAMIGASLVSIAVTPASPSIPNGTTQQFTATGTYSDNSQKDITSTVTWASATQSVATFGATQGLATGVGTGTSQITATLGPIVSPGDTLTVTPAAVISIAVTPTNPTILVGAAQQFTATGTYSDDSQQNITSTVTWASASANVASIGTSTGLATGVVAGNSKITAALSGVTSLADTLTVNNPVPAVNNLSPTHAPAGTGFTLTVNGSGFVSASSIIFNGSMETTNFINAGQLTASIPASAVPGGASVNVTVSNSPPGGGASGNANFTIDEFSVAGPGSTTNIIPGQLTPVAITLTPTADGFANPIQLAVSGLPKGMTGQFTQDPATPGTLVTTDALNLTATPSTNGGMGSGRRTPIAPLGGFVLAIFAGGLLFVRRSLRLAAVVPAAGLWLLLLCGLAASVAGCGGGFPLGNPDGTPPGPATITVTATSGTVRHMTSVVISVQE
jgi:trimeric autotransporter adhesin